MEAEDEVRITLRLPIGIRDALMKAAKENARSMNGEIVARLEASFAEPTSLHPDEIQELAADVARETVLLVLDAALKLEGDPVENMKGIHAQLSRRTDETARSKQKPG